MEDGKYLKLLAVTNLQLIP